MRSGSDPPYLIGGWGPTLVVAGSFGGSREPRVRIGRAVKIQGSHTEQHRFLDRVDQHQSAVVAVGHPIESPQAPAPSINLHIQMSSHEY